uniref:Uncharacterized protein n=1 Tax=Rhizophora mucronata TaxID=61149 RepID=A0A2P2Q7H4_RHIMU
MRIIKIKNKKNLYLFNFDTAITLTLVVIYLFFVYWLFLFFFCFHCLSLLKSHFLQNPFPTYSTKRLQFWQPKIPEGVKIQCQ